jgi:hypothetical protein
MFFNFTSYLFNNMLNVKSIVLILVIVIVLAVLFFFLVLPRVPADFIQNLISSGQAAILSND